MTGEAITVRGCSSASVHVEGVGVPRSQARACRRAGGQKPAAFVSDGNLHIHFLPRYSGPEKSWNLKFSGAL